MVWRNYYRPKQNDPNSIAALERLDEKDLSDKKEFFEDTIKIIEKIFNLAEFKKRKNSIPLKKISEKHNQIIDKYLVIDRNVNIDTKYYAVKSFFGNLKKGHIIRNITCEINNETDNFLNEFKNFTDLIIKYQKESNINSEFNKPILDFIDGKTYPPQPKIIQEVNLHRDKLRANKTIQFTPNNIRMYSFNFFKFDREGSHLNTELSKNIVNPLSFNDEYWNKAFELSLKEFEKVDDINSYGLTDLKYARGTIYLCGNFFKDVKKIITENKDLYLEYTFPEEYFIEVKHFLLKFYNSYLRKITLLNRSTKRKDALEQNFNNIYVLSNKSYEGIYKVGWTSNIPEERAEQLSGETGVLYPFKVIYSKEFKDAENIEKKIHKKFKLKRLRNNKEFFEIDKNLLIEYIKSIK